SPPRAVRERRLAATRWGELLRTPRARQVVRDRRRSRPRRRRAPLPCFARTLPATSFAIDGPFSPTLVALWSGPCPCRAVCWRLDWELAILALGLKVEDQATGRRCATVSGRRVL